MTEIPDKQTQEEIKTTQTEENASDNGESKENVNEDLVVEEEPSSREKSEEDIDLKEEEDLDLLDPKKASKFVQDNVNKAVSPIREKIEEQRIASEVKLELDNHPEYSPYKERIMKWINHPNRKGLIKQGLPVSTVIIEAVAPYLQKIGADKARLLDAEAKKSKDVGGSIIPKAPQKVDYAAMSPNEITQLNELVKSGRYKG